MPGFRRDRGVHMVPGPEDVRRAAPGGRKTGMSLYWYVRQVGYIITSECIRRSDVCACFGIRRCFRHITRALARTHARTQTRGGGVGVGRER